LTEGGRHRLIDHADAAEYDPVGQEGDELAQRHPRFGQATMPRRENIEVVSVETDQQPDRLGEGANHETDRRGCDPTLRVDPERADGADRYQHRRHRRQAESVVRVEHGRPDCRHREDEHGREHDHPEFARFGQLGRTEIRRNQRQELIAEGNQQDRDQTETGQAKQQHFTQKAA
jgi:hypothetical protein